MTSPETATSTGVPELGTLIRTDPRLVWKHEAHDFTPWLLANPERLAAALGIELELTGSEHPIGGFSLDLVGRDLTHDKRLIVENQLEESNHGHLGQLLTYAAGTDAATIVWIATKIRDEHRQALTWLNEQSGEGIHFFGVELEVVRIEDSLPAPLLNVVVLPNDWQKSVKAAASAASVSGRGSLYAAFWTRYLERLRAEHPTWSKARQTTSNNWFPMAGPIRGCIFSSVFASGGKIRHELYIDRATAEECKAVFDALDQQRGALESAYGSVLQWERLPNRKASRIAEYREGDVARSEEYDDYLDFFLAAGQRMRAALSTIVLPD